MFLMGCTFFATAQNYNLRVHKNGDVTNQWNTANISSITLDGGTATFTVDGNAIAKAFSTIDSITFYNLNGGGGNGGDVDDPDTIPSHDTTTVDPVSGIHITWNNGAAPTIVNGYASQGLEITASGEDVTVNAATGLDDLTYVLDGRSVDGNLIINTDKSLILYMQGLHLHSATGPAIRVVDDHRVTLHLATGTSNFISDTTNITDANHKAALQSQGKFEVQGDGALTVKGYTKHAIQSSGKTIIMNGTVNVYGQSTTGDAMNVDDFVMQDGSLTVTSLGDGIDADQGYLQVSGGTINITCTSQGVKGMGCDDNITIGGGNITINMSGADSKGISGNRHVYITDGTHNITVTGNQSKGIKADTNLVINGGSTTVNANGTYVLSSGNISYCTGIKTNFNTVISGGTVNIICSTSNAGGKCISADGNVTITDGNITLSALGNSGTYTATDGTKSYTTVGIKSNGSVTVVGGTTTMTVGGKGISADLNYNQNGGTVNITTSGAGAVISGSGTSATDGYCSAGVTTDRDVNITSGTISCVSTGKGGRGFKVDGNFNVGELGANDDLIHVYVKTSGDPVNASSSGGGPGGGPGGGGSSSSLTYAQNGFTIKNSSNQEIMTFKWPAVTSGQSGFEDNTTGAKSSSSKASDYWKGLPKGIKVTGSIHINSGHVCSFCAQTSGETTGEAIESKDSIIINGGYVEANAYDDAINASNMIKITGGYIWAYARGNDAIDCNGAENSGGGGWGGSSNQVNTIAITGGTIIASGTEVAVDDCGDRGGYITATNCTMVLIGGNMGVTEATPQLTGQKLINISTSTSGGGGPGGGPGGNSSSGIYVTTPEVQSGTYTVYKSPTITGGTSWHGLYTGATSTGGTSSSVTAQ